MGRRTLMAAVMLAAALALATAAAPAWGRAASLLAYAPGGTYVVRPPFMSFDETDFRGGTANYLLGPGITVKKFHHGHMGRIHWTRYGRRATGKATSFTQYCPSRDGRTLYCTQRYVVNPVTIHAWRIRHHRYTRFNLNFGEPFAYTYTYGLRTVQIKVRDRRRRLKTTNWCAVEFRSRCSHP